MNSHELTLLYGATRWKIHLYHACVSFYRKKAVKRGKNCNPLKSRSFMFGGSDRDEIFGIDGPWIEL